MESITENHCRMCLKQCRRNFEAISVEQKELYKLLTGHQIKSTDIPKTTCNSCKMFLKVASSFRKKARQAQLVLNKFQSLIKYDVTPWREVKEEQEELDTDDFLKVQVKTETNESESDAEAEAVQTNEIVDEKVEFENSEESDAPEVLGDSTAVTKKEFPFKCRHCQLPNVYETKSKSSLSYHIAKNHQLKPTPEDFFQKECPKCQQRFRRIQQLRSHLKLTHGIASLICQICGKGFDRPSKLYHHEAKFHYEELNMPVFQCEHCSAKLGSETTLRLHMKKYHLEKNCRLCGKTVSVLFSFACFVSN